MNALQLVNACLRELRQPTVTTLSGANAYTQSVLQAINKTISRLASGNVWPQLETVQEITLATGTQSYSLASDFDRLVAQPVMHDPAFRVFPVIGPAEWADETLNRTEQGAPVVCHLAGNKLYFWRIPDAGYNGKKVYVRYQKRPSDLAADNDTTVFDDQLLILYGVFEMKRLDGDADQIDLENARDLRQRILVEQLRQAPRFVRYRDF